jgi:hypothetical protein
MHAVRRAAILDVASVTAAAADSATVELRTRAGLTIAAMRTDPRSDRNGRNRRLGHHRCKNQSGENQIFHIILPSFMAEKMLPENCHVNATVPLLDQITSAGRALGQCLAAVARVT